MIPRGAIYSELRARMLANFPEGSKAVFGETSTVGEWLSTGSLSIKTSTKKIAEFEAPAVEFGRILLVEIENLLNHCFEHLQELGCASQDTRLRSDAWTTVTAYYLAFFAGGTLLRLLGKPVLFLTRQQLTDLCKLSAGPVPSQGTFEMSLSGSVSATHSKFTLKTTSKIHEATWLNLLGFLNSLQQRFTSNSDVTEVLFYNSICTKALFSQYLNFQWPSLVRIRANYRPGFSYKLDSSRTVHCKAITEWANLQPSEFVRIVSTAANACTSDINSYSNHVLLLYGLGTSLFVLARELYSDLLLRKGLDKRWELRRHAYRKRMVFPQKEYEALVRTF